MPWTLATWNVNSLKVRLPHLLTWLATHAPDIVALQETKLADEVFPYDELAAAGYASVASGQKTYNGVAVLTRVPRAASMDDIVTGIPGFPDEQKRILAVTVGDVRVVDLYVPNGQAVGSDKYRYKLAWFESLTRWLKEELVRHPRLAVLGDFNVAPEDRDVWSPKAFRGSTHVTPKERAAVARLQEWGMQDAFRTIYPDTDKLFSYWDYRRGDFHEHRGMRIDLVLATQPVIDRVQWAFVDRNARKGKLPSDHAPVVIDLAE